MIRKKRCPFCKGALTKPTHEFRATTADGLVTWEVCYKCGDTINAMAEVFSKKHDPAGDV